MNFCIGQVMWSSIQKTVSIINQYQPLPCTRILSIQQVIEQLRDKKIIKDPGPFEMLNILGLTSQALAKTSDTYGKLKQAKHALYETLLTTHTLLKFGVFQEPLTHAHEHAAFEMLLRDVSNHQDGKYHLYTLLSSKLMKDWDDYLISFAEDSEESSDDEVPQHYSGLELTVKYEDDFHDDAEFKEVIADSQALVTRLQVNGEGLDRVIADDVDFLAEVAKVKMIVEDSLPLKYRLKLADANDAAWFQARNGQLSQEHVWCHETLKFFYSELSDQEWSRSVIETLQEFCDRFAQSS